MTWLGKSREPDEWELRRIQVEAMAAIEGTQTRYCECGCSFQAMPKAVTKWCCERCRCRFATYRRKLKIHESFELVVLGARTLPAPAYDALMHLRSVLDTTPVKPARCRDSYQSHDKPTQRGF